ncbi:hypothetical protein [Fischerella thermalis]|jgi:hypothetical protein|uniref:Uncharacterized protein n=1 Tax=Fischerella thermalis JSC-11 TaxID=741277 RepID=G6FP48_9CYAN|nr:hypothetical protein [Fischerella thermalis]EHC18648.1 hypothetical protein FJSC11DRAFT_0628 [Fischerella thermalis JSC-11]PLZ11346.1 hypothetical protein CBP18_08160 [Fischerella thermalis WC119]PLZ79186.1 hypothetical protein CBP14_01625 [Fischerella thermalis WC245]PLZ80694.1 hypothetical protein CBP20_10860 [Fischerella thermalis WC213]PMB33395.1 hypothetical protein CEN42_11285 [Fischerella thermalis CCMEE 5208]
MTVCGLQNIHINLPIFKSNVKQIDVHLVQEKIYSFFVKIVNKYDPEDVLIEFKSVFLDCLVLKKLDLTLGIYDVFIDNEHHFRNTLKRCCYILVNNWESNRKHKYTQALIELIDNYKSTAIDYKYKKIMIFQTWLDNFIQSQDFQELKLFAYKNENKADGHWVNRYTSYLLAAQVVDKKNPKEQKEAAKKASKQLKDKFKFELAMYVARSQSNASSQTRYRNPSALGDDILRLIKAIVVRKGVFSYDNIANIFLKQTQNQTFKDFKESLVKYLIFSVQQPKFVETLQQQLSEKLLIWKPECNDVIINKYLLLRTCNRMIDFLTTDNSVKPSSLFVLLLSQGHPLTLVIVLLKIILICKHSRSHLESRIAHLIRYYDRYSEAECQWFINFIEIFNITFAIYAENVEYNLIKVEETEKAHEVEFDPNAYRVFSQLKR